jgi:hypothetical protein
MINKRLKAKIVRKYGTQWDFGQAIGEHHTVVSQVVRGRRNLSDVKKVEWARALGCQPEDIFPDWRDD